MTAAAIAFWIMGKRLQPLTIEGMVMQRDSDPAKEVPIGNARVTVFYSNKSVSTTAETSGLFHLTFPVGVKSGQPIIIRLDQQEYMPLVLHDFLTNKIYLARMISRASMTPAPRTPYPAVIVSNVSLRYTTNVTTSVNVGSTVKPIEVKNKGDIPCNGTQPCSPDGRWKASTVSTAMDAGEENEYHNIRLSCIAGPCPFTRVRAQDFSRPSRTIKISILNWSDTTTFLLEAEVFHVSIANMLRRSYPVQFGPTFNFTLPGDSEGPSIEADLNGKHIIFPLGPSLYLSWANCTSTIGERNTAVFRCELKPGYRF